MCEVQILSRGDGEGSAAQEPQGILRRGAPQD